MAELDPATLEKIALEVESMPPESRALMYRAMPHLGGPAENPVSDGSSMNTPESARKPAPGPRTTSTLEDRVRAAARGFDFTSLVGQPVLGRPADDPEVTEETAFAAHPPIPARSAISPLLVIESPPREPVVIPPAPEIVHTVPALSSQAQALLAVAASLLVLATAGIAMKGSGNGARQGTEGPAPATAAGASSPVTAAPAPFPRLAIPASPKTADGTRSLGATVRTGMTAAPDRDKRQKAPERKKRAVSNPVRRGSRSAPDARALRGDPDIDRDVNRLLNRL